MEEPPADSEGRGDGARLSVPQLSRARLDELLREVLTAQDRLSELLDAVVRIGSDLDLHSVLERITTAGARLANAKYCALGVLGDDEKLAEFLPYGITAEEIAGIGNWPEGHGILGLLITDPEPIRIPRISDHPRSYGFPPNHPVMNSFLGVPIRIRNQVFGNLYLTEKQDAGEFTEQDEQIVTALASAAGFVIENARLYGLTEQRWRWLEASTEITEALLASTDRDAALRLIVSRAREVSGSAMSAVILHSEDKRPVIKVVDRFDESVVGKTVHSDVVKQVMESGRTKVVPDLYQIIERSESWASTTGARRLGRSVLVAFTGPSGTGGVLVVAADRDRGRVLSQEETRLLESFAAQASLALDLAQAQTDREMLTVLSDRDRIARDLHDVVIQRLFAAGMQLQGTASRSRRPDVRQRIDSVVENLDTTIHDLRATIFELHRGRDETSPRAGVTALVSEYTDTLGFAPHVEITGPIDTAVPDDMRPHLMAVIREGLSNIARHSTADQAHITIAADADEVLVRLIDNGDGPPADMRESGLRNLRQRAETFGGTMTLTHERAVGTVLQWRASVSTTAGMER